MTHQSDRRRPAVWRFSVGAWLLVVAASPLASCFYRGVVWWSRPLFSVCLDGAVSLAWELQPWGLLPTILVLRATAVWGVTFVPYAVATGMLSRRLGAVWLTVVWALVVGHWCWSMVRGWPSGAGPRPAGVFAVLVSATALGLGLFMAFRCGRLLANRVVPEAGECCLLGRLLVSALAVGWIGFTAAMVYAGARWG